MSAPLPSPDAVKLSAVAWCTKPRVLCGACRELNLLDEPPLAVAFSASLRTSFVSVPHAMDEPVGELLSARAAPAVRYCPALVSSRPLLCCRK
jgi:hypothetical protein